MASSANSRRVGFQPTNTGAIPVGAIVRKIKLRSHNSGVEFSTDIRDVASSSLAGSI